MNEIDLSQFYSAGYFIIRKNHPGWEQLDPDLLPPKLISLSTCICPRVGVYWGWTPGDKDATLDFGIPESKWDEFKAWCQQDYLEQMDYISMFYSPKSAQSFFQRFLPNTDEYSIIGVGLPIEIEAYFLQEASAQDMNHYGIQKRILEHIPIDKSGEILGFEIVSFGGNDFGHSWLCSGINKDMKTLFGILSNYHGVINSYEEAKKVYEWIAEDNMKGSRGEPEPYLFWLFMSYPLEGNS